MSSLDPFSTFCFPHLQNSHSSVLIAARGVQHFTLVLCRSKSSKRIDCTSHGHHITNSTLVPFCKSRSHTQKAEYEHSSRASGVQIHQKRRVGGIHALPSHITRNDRPFFSKIVNSKRTAITVMNYAL